MRWVDLLGLVRTSANPLSLTGVDDRSSIRVGQVGSCTSWGGQPTPSISLQPPKRRLEHADHGADGPEVVSAYGLVGIAWSR